MRKSPAWLLGALAVAAAAPPASAATPLVGNAKVAPHSGKARSGKAAAFPFYAFASRRTGSARVYLGKRNRAKRLHVGLYADASGRPGRRLVSGSRKGLRAGRWNTVRLGGVSVQRGRRYWIAVLGTGGRPDLRVRRGTACRRSGTTRSRLRRLPSRWQPGARSSACGVSAVVEGASRAAAAPGATPGAAPVAPPAAPAPSARPAPAAPPAPAPSPPRGAPAPSTTGIAGCPPLAPRGGGTITQAGAVLQNADISGSIRIDAPGVTLRCVRVRADGDQAVVADGGGTLVERAELDCQGRAGNDAGITGSGYTLRRADVHGCEDGAKVGENVVVEDSWIHDLNTAASDPHYDGLQIMGCACYTGGVLRHVVIRGNRIEPRPPVSTGRSNGVTSSIIVQSAFSGIDDVLVEGNTLSCGSFVVYSRDSGNGVPTNVRFNGNRFTRCYEFGIKSFDGIVGWSGNVWDDSGAPIR